MNKRPYLIGAAVVVVIAVGFLVLHMMKPSSAATVAKSSVPPVNNSIVMTKSSSSLGQYLTDPQGRPLYIFTGDKPGVSNCTSTCLAAWPAYTTTAQASGLPIGFGVITRTDNHQIQYTYNGMPLYFFVQDTGSQVTGNGTSGFQVAKPVQSPKSVSKLTSSSTSTSAAASTPAASAAKAQTQPAATAQSTPAPQAPTPTPYSSGGSGW